MEEVTPRRCIKPGDFVVACVPAAPVLVVVPTVVVSGVDEVTPRRSIKPGDFIVVGSAVVVAPGVEAVPVVIGVEVVPVVIGVAVTPVVIGLEVVPVVIGVGEVPDVPTVGDEMFMCAISSSPNSFSCSLAYLEVLLNDS